MHNDTMVLVKPTDSYSQIFAKKSVTIITLRAVTIGKTHPLYP